MEVMHLTTPYIHSSYYAAYCHLHLRMPFVELLGVTDPLESRYLGI